MIRSSFLNNSSATAGSIPADVYNKVSKIMQAQKTDAPKLNAALTSDNVTLSGLGQLQSALTSFKGIAGALGEKTSDRLSQNVTNLISGFNALNATLTRLRQGDLKKDGSALSIQNQLASILNSSSGSTISPASDALAKIGISIQKNGDLALDTAKLQAVISANPAGVAKLFTDSGNGFADKWMSQIDGLVKSSGVLPGKVTAINKDISALNAKKTALENKLTAQANALVKLYSQQANTSLIGQSTGQSTPGYSLFNYIT